MTYQRNSPRTLSVAVRIARNRAQVVQLATRATRPASSTSQRQPIHHSSSSPQPPPFGEGFERAFEVFNQPFFQNLGNATNPASAEDSEYGLDVQIDIGTTRLDRRSVFQYGPSHSTTIGLDQIPPQARRGVM
jgi:hypothetical protein